MANKHHYEVSEATETDHYHFKKETEHKIEDYESLIGNTLIIKV